MRRKVLQLADGCWCRLHKYLKSASCPKGKSQKFDKNPSNILIT